MKRSPELSVLALWAIAVVATALLAWDGAIFAYLGPVYFVCAVGSIRTVRKARELGR